MDKNIMILLIVVIVAIVVYLIYANSNQVLKEKAQIDELKARTLLAQQNRKDLRTNALLSLFTHK